MKYLTLILSVFFLQANYVLAQNAPLNPKSTMKEKGIMKLIRPQKIAINHDNYYAKHVGRTKDGFQFFLTNPFEPAGHDGKKEGSEYIALFKFDDDGNLVEHSIDNLGPRASLDKKEAKNKYMSRLNELGEVQFSRIEVKPFSVNHNGVDFGLIVRKAEDEAGTWVVEMYPGNYMAFFPPWDSGYYEN